jgi:heterodisulfide reductase subunit A-like polyferredoxin
MTTVLKRKEADVIEYCEENKHLFTDEEIRFFELAAQGKIHSSKFWRRKSEAVIDLTRKAFAENPEQGLKLVIVSILNTLPEHTPTDKLEQYISAIIQEWQALQAARTELSQPALILQC